MNVQDVEKRLQGYHDASLVSLSVEWAAGQVTLYVKKSGSSECIIVKSMTDLQCPRAFPWGRSGSINTANVSGTSPALILNIEMQSGDLVRVAGGAISIESAAHADDKDQA